MGSGVRSAERGVGKAEAEFLAIGKLLAIPVGDWSFRSESEFPGPMPIATLGFEVTNDDYRQPERSQ